MTVAKQRNVSDKLEVGPKQPPSDFDKFVSGALDQVLTMAPDASNPEVATVIPEAKAGVVPGIDQSPNANIEPTPQLTEQTVKPAETLSMEQQGLSAYQAMLREEEARIANRVNNQPTSVVQTTPVDTRVKVAKVLSLEEQTLSSYRATLRAEEERMRALPPVKPLPEMPGRNALQGAAFTHHSIPDPVFKEGADPLAVKSYLLLRRMVAGQYINPFGDVYHEVQKLLAEMKGTLETNVAPQVPSPILEKK